MLFSLAIAFIVTPWAAYRLFKGMDLAHGHGGHDQASSSRMARLYRRVMNALIARPSVRWPFFGAVALVLLLAMAMVGMGMVKVKMLPFDNKSEFQVLIDHPEGTPLEVTLETARQMKAYLATVPEVKNLQLYGQRRPLQLQRTRRVHYFLRRYPVPGRPAGEPLAQGTTATRRATTSRSASARGSWRSPESAGRA